MLFIMIIIFIISIIVICSFALTIIIQTDICLQCSKLIHQKR